MTAARFSIIVNAFVVIYLCLGFVGHVWEIEGIKFTRFGLFACTLICLAVRLAFWVERQERKERRGERNPPGQ